MLLLFRVLLTEVKAVVGTGVGVVLYVIVREREKRGEREEGGGEDEIGSAERNKGDLTEPSKPVAVETTTESTNSGKSLVAYFPTSTCTSPVATADDGDGATSAPLYNKIPVSTGVSVSVGTGISLANASSVATEAGPAGLAGAGAGSAAGAGVDCHVEGAVMVWPKEEQRDTAKSMVAVFFGRLAEGGEDVSYLM